MAATLSDLRATKEKLEKKLADIKQKIVVVDVDIFKAETGIYAAAAKRAAATDPKFMELVKREMERAELEAKTPKVRAKKA